MRQKISVIIQLCPQESAEFFAFKIEGENQFLISASRVFNGFAEISQVSIYHGKTWKIIDVKVVFNSLENVDTVVFKHLCDISPRYTVNNAFLFTTYTHRQLWVDFN